MKFSNANLVNLYTGQEKSQSLFNRFGFEFRGKEYIYVCNYNAAVKLPYGDYFFMEVITGKDGRAECRKIESAEFAELLWMEMYRRKRFGRIMEKKMQKAFSSYDLVQDENGDPFVRERHITFLKRKNSGRIGCEVVGDSQMSLPEWRAKNKAPDPEVLPESYRKRLSVLSGLSHGGKEYLYIRETAGEEESGYFAQLKNSGEGKAIEIPAADTELFYALWSQVIRLLSLDILFEKEDPDQICGCLS